MLLTSGGMKALEERAFANGVSAETLMEEAGVKIAEAVRQFFPIPGDCHAFFGKGHNGGDALVAARHLAAAGWSVSTDAVFDEAQWAPLTRKKFLELTMDSNQRIGPAPRIILDGILGIGATGRLRGPIVDAVRRINEERRRGAYVFAVDLPTGLHADTGEVAGDAVIADFTLTIGAVKRGLVADTATRYVGRLSLLPLARLDAVALPSDGRANETVATAHALGSRLSPR